MKEITMLMDYKDHFGSNYGEFPYRSGLNIKLLTTLFLENDIEVKFVNFSEVHFNQNWKDKIVLYTSSEDIGYYYKSFIEDIILGLELAGANVIPPFKYLRANNNKVFMEILRKEIFGDDMLRSQVFGTLEELKKSVSRNEIGYPCVIKTARGAMSRGVASAYTENELLSKADKLSKTISLYHMFYEFIRGKKHKGYLRESQNRNKFIVQPMVQGLKNDWKILIYGNHIYSLKRSVRKNDFRASGSGVNYLTGSESGLTDNMLNYIWSVYEKLDIPLVSIDYINDGINNGIVEFQALYFGPATQVWSKDYYEYNKGSWQIKEKKHSIEEAFVYGIVYYLKQKKII